MLTQLNKEINGQIKQRNKPRKRKSMTKLTTTQLRKLKQMMLNVNCPSLRVLAAKFGVHFMTIKRYAARFGLKLVRKHKLHGLTPVMIEKRKKMALKFYNLITQVGVENIVTLDESYVRLGDAIGISKYQYIAQSASRSEADILPHFRGQTQIMIVYAMCMKGKFNPIVMPKNVTLNQVVFRDTILPQIIDQAIKIYGHKKFWLHFDSAPAHTAKLTQKYLQDNGINYFTKEQWPPNSPDISPNDYFLFGHLKTQTRKRSATSRDELLKITKRVLSNIPQEMINRALESWPDRVYKLHLAKGRHIENFN